MYYDNKEKVSDVYGEFCDVGVFWLEMEVEVEGGVSLFVLLDIWLVLFFLIFIFGEFVFLLFI